jgi:hypothetical protein
MAKKKKIEILGSHIERSSAYSGRIFIYRDLSGGPSGSFSERIAEECIEMLDIEDPHQFMRLLMRQAT